MEGYFKSALPAKSPKLNKFYFHIDTPKGTNKGFAKHAYQIINENNNLTLVHYIGDDSLSEDFPHRSAKATRSYFCTLPSYLKSNEEQLKLSKASVVYKNEITRLNDDAIAGPRNAQQFRNLRFKIQSTTRITRDELYNVYEISKSNSDFIGNLRLIQT